MGITYRLTPHGKTRRGLPGVPWRDHTDAEHAAALVRYPNLDAHGYFEHVAEEEGVNSPSPSSSRRQIKEQPEAVTEESDEG